MIKVNVAEIKAKLSEYLDRAARGERIVVCRHNKPVAELRPVAAPRTEPRPIGPLPGETAFDVPPSFFEPLPPEELDAWDGIATGDPLSRAWPGPPDAGGRVAERRSRTAVRPARRRRPRRQP